MIKLLHHSNIGGAKGKVINHSTSLAIKAVELVATLDLFIIKENDMIG